uniref:GP-PDE domain-containing protein n=1 Tax=Laticauda laticaudata TaxID=8630 RepID=A0A8C5RR93_LATLA
TFCQMPQRAPKEPPSVLEQEPLQRSQRLPSSYLGNDPFWTVSSLSPSDFVKAANQSVCKLTEMLETIKDNTSILLNLQNLPEDHPYYTTSVNVTLDTILTSGIPQQVMWLPSLDRHLVQEIAPGFQQTCGQKMDAQRLRDRGFQKLNLRYTQVTHEDIREYTSANLSVNLYIVNEPWLYSLLWCMGVESITSDNSQVLFQLPSPLWLMPPDEYHLIWITADLISFVIIVGIFIFQNYHLIRWRFGSIRTYNPEQIMLSAAVRRSSRDVNIMKEKLIFSGEKLKASGQLIGSGSVAPLAVEETGRAKSGWAEQGRGRTWEKEFRGRPRPTPSSS